MPKLIHTEIRVTDINISLRFYQQAFGLKETHRIEFDDFSLVYLRNFESEAEIELTWSSGQAEYSHGSCYGQVAFVVDDLGLHFKQLCNLGLKPAPIRSLKEETSCWPAPFLFRTPTATKSKFSSEAGTTSKTKYQQSYASNEGGEEQAEITG